MRTDNCGRDRRVARLRHPGLGGGLHASESSPPISCEAPTIRGRRGNVSRATLTDARRRPARRDRHTDAGALRLRLSGRWTLGASALAAADVFGVRAVSDTRVVVDGAGTCNGQRLLISCATAREQSAGRCHVDFVGSAGGRTAAPGAGQRDAGAHERPGGDRPSMLGRIGSSGSPRRGRRSRCWPSSGERASACSGCFTGGRGFSGPSCCSCAGGRRAGAADVSLITFCGVISRTSGRAAAGVRRPGVVADLVQRRHDPRDGRDDDRGRHGRSARGPRSPHSSTCRQRGDRRADHVRIPPMEFSCYRG